MERKFFGLAIADVTRLAYQLAVRNGIKNQFCKRNEKTGRKWLKIFLNHQEISVTTPAYLLVFLNLRTRYVNHLT